jgi:hypothetical protein
MTTYCGSTEPATTGWRASPLLSHPPRRIRICANEPHYPPLRTVLEHALASADGVMAYRHRAPA